MVAKPRDPGRSFVESVRLFSGGWVEVKARRAVMGELGCTPSGDLGRRIAGNPKLAADLFDRLAIDEMTAPDLRYRLHNQRLCFMVALLVFSRSSRMVWPRLA